MKPIYTQWHLYFGICLCHKSCLPRDLVLTFDNLFSIPSLFTHPLNADRPDCNFGLPAHVCPFNIWILLEATKKGLSRK